MLHPSFFSKVPKSTITIVCSFKNSQKLFLSADGIPEQRNKLVELVRNWLVRLLGPIKICLKSSLSETQSSVTIRKCCLIFESIDGCAMSRYGSIQNYSSFRIPMNFICCALSILNYCQCIIPSLTKKKSSFRTSFSSVLSLLSSFVPSFEQSFSVSYNYLY